MVKLRRVDFMPSTFEEGVLYYSEQYGTAAHLCACGCGSKIRTPIGPTEWAIDETDNGVSLCPSVGNWQRPCKSHYWITDGEIVWNRQWTDDQVRQGRKREAARRATYYAERSKSRGLRGVLRRLKRPLSG